MRLLRGIAALALAAAIVPLSSPALGPGRSGGSGLSESGFRTYLPQLEAQARRAGVSPGTIVERLSEPRLQHPDGRARPRPARRTAGEQRQRRPSRPIAPATSTPALIANGQRHYAANLARLSEIGRRYGVTPSVLVAIWGHETSYGAVTGDFDLLNSLATLAYEGRRRQLFADEFVATLKMIDRGVPRSAAQGQLGRRHRLSAIPAERLSAPRQSTATATAAPTSGAASPTRSPRSPIISAMPAGSRTCPGASRSACRPASTGRAIATPARRAALPAGPRAPQPLADDRRVAAARHRPA